MEKIFQEEKSPFSGGCRVLASKHRYRPALLILFIAALFLIFASPFFGGCSRPLPKENGTGVNSPQPAAGDNPAGKTPAENDERPLLPGVVFVSIGNNPSARPQSGLSGAAIVYEAPAEGGITRLLAGFTRKTDKIGPVRSARKCLVQIAVGYDTPFAHCGGSEDSFQIIRREKTKSMDEIYSAGECFWRTKDREAPDNLYTSTDKLIEGAERRGFAISGLPPSPKGEFSGKPAVVIEYNFSRSERYPNVVRYVFQGSRYERSINGDPHKDDQGNVISPANLVFMEVKTTYPKGKAVEIDMDVTGRGRALFFSRGLVAEGTWEKPALKEPVRFFAGEKQVPFAEGMVWVHLVPDLSQVKVSAQNQTGQSTQTK